MNSIVPDENVYVVKARPRMSDLKSVYAERPAVILGLIQLCCGILASILELVVVVQGSHPWGAGIWTGGVFVITGGFTIAGGKTGKR